MAPKNANGPKTIAVLVEDVYQEMEVWYPAYRIREAGHKTVFLGTGKPEYKSKLGYPVKAEGDIKEARARDFDGVIVPGGYAPDLLRRSPEVLAFVAELDRAGKPIGAICHAGWVLCSAGILKGRTATCFFAIKDDLANAGAKVVDQEVVVDRNLVTSRKPDDLPAFMREYLKVLAGK
ncbi:MAG TPA: type 1 glutamine amidotransferase domain-containing protein [Planctomycetota bacterium]|nr:type 1 glutamine amidotransferase domain-containing protein [Planctomycetota bacterium]